MYLQLLRNMLLLYRNCNLITNKGKGEKKMKNKVWENPAMIALNAKETMEENEKFIGVPGDNAPIGSGPAQIGPVDPMRS